MSLEQSCQRSQAANDQATNLVRLAHGNADFKSFYGEFGRHFPTTMTLDGELIDRLYACVSSNDELASVLSLLAERPVPDGFLVVDDRALVTALLFLLQEAIAFEQTLANQWALSLEPTHQTWQAVGELLDVTKPYLQSQLPAAGSAQ